MNTDGNARTVRLVPLDTVYMDDPLLAVHLDDLALTPLVLPSDDPHLIILPYSECPCLRQWGLSTYGPRAKDGVHYAYCATPSTTKKT
jgi:hypothetical protein